MRRDVARGPRGRGAQAARLAVVSAALVAAALSTQRLAFVGLATPPARPGAAPRHSRGSSGLGKTAVGAGERAAYIAVVEVDVKPGDEAAFLEASMENARQSKLEENNQRFDVLQLQSDISKYALVEIYRNEQGPTDHKGTPHYAAWRDTVADMMATPRSASQWDTVFPSSASDYAPNALILERDVPMFFDITHVFVDVKPGSEQAFIEATMENAKASLGEADARCLRFDIMQSVEDPTKFMLQEVFRSRQASASHKGEPHYEIWRDQVAGMMASPRTAKRYINHFPNLAAGWKV